MVCEASPCENGYAYLSDVLADEFEAGDLLRREQGPALVLSAPEDQWNGTTTLNANSVIRVGQPTWTTRDGQLASQEQSSPHSTMVMLHWLKYFGR